MTYSVDLAYMDYYKGAAEGKYDSNPVQDRLKVTGIAAGTAFVGVFRTLGRVVNLVTETAKVIFYTLASLFTLGQYGNAKRLCDHCKLLVLNTTALIAQPLQIIIHTLAIIIGIISPKAAYRTMQGGSAFITWITSHETEIWKQYQMPKFYKKVSETLKLKISNVFNKSSWPVQMTMKTIINEFSPAFDSALVAPLGYMNQFHSFEANPKNLSEEQKKLTPILLLNGNYSHQATFLPLLHALKFSDNQRPVYTVNLPPNTFDTSIISSKVNAIKNQYGIANDASFEIDMLGHSMGSKLIQEFGCIPNDKQEVKIRHAITVGTPFFSEAMAKEPKKAFDIIGKKDCLSIGKSILPNENQIEIKTGHLGLLFHPKSLNAMIQFLKGDSIKNESIQELVGN